MGSGVTAENSEGLAFRVFSVVEGETDIEAEVGEEKPLSSFF